MLSTFLFYEKDAVVGISVLFVRARKRHVTAAGTLHLGLSAFAPFSGALFFFNRMARELLHPLPTEQELLEEHLPQPCNAVCAYHPNIDLGIRFCRGELFDGLKPFRPIRAIRSMGCSVGMGWGQWSREKWTSPGDEPTPVWSG